MLSALLVTMAWCTAAASNSSSSSDSSSSSSSAGSSDSSDELSTAFHAGRRAALRQLLPPASVAIFFAAPERVRSGDFNYTYCQERNFYYLSGLNETDAVLIISKDSITLQGQTSNEFMVVQPRDAVKELWNGALLGEKGVKTQLGFQAVFINKDFESLLPQLEKISNWLVSFPIDLPCNTNALKGSLNAMQALVQTKAQNRHLEKGGLKLQEYLTSLRLVKQPEEINLLKKAIAISCNGHIALMKGVHTGLTEYQAQAIMEYEFKKGGAEDLAYPSILGGGENSCTLHYDKNRKTLLEGEVLLADCGAEYHGYTADITRTMPVNGKFTEAQKLIYQLVLDAQRAGIEAALSGNDFYAPAQVAQEVIKKGLVKLGIIGSEKDYRIYFMHGTSHDIGLQVHDVRTEDDRKLQAGNVITVEPGIYIPVGSNCDSKWWNIGVRIEDDVLITESGPIVLSDSVPREINQIESLHTY